LYLFDFCKELLGNIEIREQVRKNRELGTNFEISNENPHFLLHIIVLPKNSCTINYSFNFFAIRDFANSVKNRFGAI
jgi:hypothetical protein